MEYRPLYEEYFALMVEIGQHWEALSRVMLRDYWVLFYYSLFFTGIIPYQKYYARNHRGNVSFF